MWFNVLNFCKQFILQASLHDVIIIFFFISFSMFSWWWHKNIEPVVPSHGVLLCGLLAVLVNQWRTYLGAEWMLKRTEFRGTNFHWEFRISVLPPKYLNLCFLACYVMAFLKNQVAQLHVHFVYLPLHIIILKQKDWCTLWQWACDYMYIVLLHVPWNITITNSCARLTLGIHGVIQSLSQ